MNNQKEMHVIFGTGPLGKAVMNELLSKGKQVRMVNRSGKVNAPKQVEVVKGDAINRADVHRVCQNASVIYNCAKPPYSEWGEKFLPIVDGLIEGAAYSGAVLVHADNLYMYGPSNSVITEELPYNATGVKGKVRINMSKRILEAHKSGKIKATIGRASDFYGPEVDESAVTISMIRGAMGGKSAAVLGNIDIPHTYTYIEDFARGLVTLATEEKALGQAWHIPSAETITTRQLITLIYDELGKTPKFTVASKGMVFFFGIFSKSMREMKEMMYLYTAPLKVSHEKFEKAFGSKTTPHKIAISETIEWAKKNM